MLRITSLITVLLAGCEVGSFPPGGGTGGDAATVDDSGIPIDAVNNNACVNRTTPAEAAHVHTASMTTRAGETCTTAGCHSAADNDPWLVAGTVYNTAGTAVQAGVLVRIKQGTGTPLRAVTDDAGNFHIQALGQTVTYPTTVEVTACLNTPDIKPMVMAISSVADLDCSKSGCHAANDRINF